MARSGHVQTIGTNTRSGKPSDFSDNAVEGQKANLPSKQEDDVEERLQKIVAAIKQLKPEDFTQAGPPKVEAIEKILGFDINAAERDEAWSLVTPEPKHAEEKAPEKAPEQKEKTMVTGEDALKLLRSRGAKV